MAEQEYERRLEDLRDDVAEMKAVFKQMMADLKGTVGAKVDGRVNRMREHLDKGVDWVRDAWDAAYARGQKAAQDVGRRVEEKPYHSMLIALGVGLVVGRLLGMRRSA